jgi:hypothetical protein
MSLASFIFTMTFVVVCKQLLNSYARVKWWRLTPSKKSDGRNRPPAVESAACGRDQSGRCIFTERFWNCAAWISIDSLNEVSSINVFGNSGIAWIHIKRLGSLRLPRVSDIHSPVKISKLRISSSKRNLSGGPPPSGIQNNNCGDRHLL